MRMEGNGNAGRRLCRQKDLVLQLSYFGQLTSPVCTACSHSPNKGLSQRSKAVAHVQANPAEAPV